MTQLLCQMGMVEYNAPPLRDPSESYLVSLDGHLIGWLHSSIAKDFAERLRVMKVKGFEGVSVFCHLWMGGFLFWAFVLLSFVESDGF